MGSEFGVRFRKCVVISIRRSYRSVCNHPFFIGILCFLVLLNRAFPSAFSLLVTASPVLVCTAVLLGTLLSFGQPNIPEIEKDDKVSHQLSPLQTGFPESTRVVERDGSFDVDRHVREKSDTLPNITREGSSVRSKLSDTDDHTDAMDYRHCPDGSSEDVHFDKRVIGELDKSVPPQEKLQSKGILSTGDDGEDSLLLFKRLGEGNVMEEGDRSPVDTVCGQMHDQDGSSMLSSWERIGHHDDADADADDESIDSESDGGESSSPDASMADIIPILDELHPLLDLEAPQPAPMSHNVSDTASNESIDSSSSDSDAVVSDEDMENQGEVDDEEDESSKEAIKSTDDESKSAIKWTENDEKNLMDLGTSELERNKRLEKLIARRRARKTMAEKNLIDLDGADIPFSIPTISTVRRNPFDLPDDSCDSMGLPTIPGSAPSVLQPRRNPFDLPYDSSEEKPDLKGDSFHEEFSAFQEKEAFLQREAVFRRHESFNVGPSTLGFMRLGKQDSSWRPYFVPEHLPTGATSSQFQRQLSEISESKVSTVPETESAESVIDEEVKQNEPSLFQHTDGTSAVEHAFIHDEETSHSSEDIKSIDLEHAGNGDVDHDVVEIILGNVEDFQQTETSVSEGREVIMNTEQSTSEIHPSIKHIDEDSSTSSLCSISETVEKAPDVKEEASNNSEPHDSQIMGRSISSQGSLEELEFHDIQHEEPVYDLSPSSVKQVPSLILVDSASKEPVVQCEGVKIDSPKHEFQAGSTEALDEDELRLVDLSKTSVRDPSNLSSEYVSADSTSPEQVLQREQAENQPVHQSQNLEGSSKLRQEGLGNDKDECLNPTSADYRPSISVSNPSEAVVEMQRMEQDESRVRQDENYSSGLLDHISEAKPTLHEDNASPKLGRVNTFYHDAGTSIDDNRCDQVFYSPYSNYQDVNSPSVGKGLSFEVEDNVQATLATGVESRETQEVQDPENKSITSFTFDSTPVLPGSSVLSDGNEDSNMKSKMLEEIVGKEQEEFTGKNNAAQGIDSSSIQMHTSEDIDETKKIDKEILSELDAVGDFNVKETAVVKEPKSSDSESVNPPNAVIENGVSFPVLEARTIDDIGLAFKQLQHGVDVRNDVFPSMENLEEHERLDLGKPAEDVNIHKEEVSESSPVEVQEFSKSTDKPAEEDLNGSATTKVSTSDGSRMMCEEVSEMLANGISDQNENS